MNEAVNYETAVADVTSWLDHKKVSQNKRDSLQGMIDNITGAVSDGSLVLMEDMKWKHILKFPLTADGNVTTAELSYKPRINDANIEPYKKVVKGVDFDSSLKRVILALTGKSLGEINNLDSSTDRAIAESIAVFFV